MAGKIGPVIGLSLAKCIEAMIHGEVDPADVGMIASRTKAENREDFARVVDSYQKMFWYDAPEQAAELAWTFFNEGRLNQLQLTRGVEREALVNAIDDGIWRFDDTQMHTPELQQRLAAAKQGRGGSDEHFLGSLDNDGLDGPKFGKN